MIHCFILYEEGIEKYRNSVNQYNKLRKIIIASTLQEALLKLLMSFKKPYAKADSNFLKCFKRAWNATNLSGDSNDTSVNFIIGELKYLSDEELQILKKNLNESIETDFVEIRKRVTYGFYFEEHPDLLKITGLVVK